MPTAARPSFATPMRRQSGSQGKRAGGQGASRIEAMERYVTSRQYDLNREFSKL